MVRLTSYDAENESLKNFGYETVYCVFIIVYGWTIRKSLLIFGILEQENPNGWNFCSTCHFETYDLTWVMFGFSFNLIFLFLICFLSLVKIIMVNHLDSSDILIFLNINY